MSKASGKISKAQGTIGGLKNQIEALMGPSGGGSMPVGGGASAGLVPPATLELMKEAVQRLNVLTGTLTSASDSMTSLNDHTAKMSGDILSVMTQMSVANSVVSQIDDTLGPCTRFLEGLGSLAGGAQEMFSSALSSLDGVLEALTGLSGLDDLKDNEVLNKINETLIKAKLAMRPVKEVTKRMDAIVATEAAKLMESAKIIEQFALSSQLTAWAKDPCAKSVIENVAGDEIKELLAV